MNPKLLVTKALKSKQLIFSYLLAIFAIIELNVHMLESTLGDKFPVVFIGISIITAILRMVTTGPLEAREKIMGDVNES